MTEPDVLLYRLAEAERDISSLRTEIAAIKRDADLREQARLKAGIGALGTAVLTLAGILWAYRSAIFK